MDRSKQDLLHIENLIKAIKKGTFTLDGLEALAFAESFKWLGKLGLDLHEQLKKIEAQQAMMAQAVAAPKPEPALAPAPEAPQPPPEVKAKRKPKKTEAE